MGLKDFTCDFVKPWPLCRRAVSVSKVCLLIHTMAQVRSRNDCNKFVPPRETPRGRKEAPGN